MSDNEINSAAEFEKMDEGEVTVKGKTESPAAVKDDLEMMTEGGGVEPVVVENPTAPAVEVGKPVAEGMVAVPAAEWKKVQETLEILRESSNQGKLTQAENKRKPKELPRAYLKVYDGHIIVSWKSSKSDLIYAPNNPTTAIGEILKAEYFYFEGGSTGVIDQVYVNREEDRVWIRIKKKEGKKLVVEFESGTSEFGKPLPVTSGQEFEIDMDFINPQ